MTTAANPARVVKRSHTGSALYQYHGQVVTHERTWVQIEAFFEREDVIKPYVTFRQGDRMVETYFTDRWYNIFELHDVADDHLKGWYCNITRPAEISHDSEGILIAADDLALDVFIDPFGEIWVLDEDEFADIRHDLPDTDAHAAWAAVDTLCDLVGKRTPPFDAI